jgi:hypothetical protein
LERFEAQQQGIQLIENPQSYKVAKEVFTNIVNKNKELRKNKIYILKEPNLKLTYDWGNIHTSDGKIPDNCKPEQIIRWEENENSDKTIIKVDPIKFNELDYLDKIIYIFHEPMYALSRYAGDTTSELTRENVIDLLKVVQSNSNAKQVSNESISCKVKLEVKDSSTLLSLSDEEEKEKRVKSFTSDIREQFEKLNKENKTNYIVDDTSKSELKIKLFNESSNWSENGWKFKLSGTLNEVVVEGIGGGYWTSGAVRNAIQNLIENLPKCEN